MQKIGERLQVSRKERKLSLREVENALSIRIGHLEAIEEGTIKGVLAPVYAIGFLKLYAEFLGVDPKKLSQEYPEVFHTNAPLPEFSYGISTLEERGSIGGGVNWLPSLFWTSGIAVGGIILYYIFKLVRVL
ncbi:MAG: hypothetical protein KR126chlam1_01303 [Chlamydiae bacterium]|nr:hypothetical protein [Chlamydiota bacterium]